MCKGSIAVRRITGSPPPPPPPHLAAPLRGLAGGTASAADLPLLLAGRRVFWGEDEIVEERQGLKNEEGGGDATKVHPFIMRVITAAFN